MKVLVTGGAGYIGTHIAVELAQAGHEPVLFDNFSNASWRAVAAVRGLAGREIRCWNGDVRDPDRLDEVFADGFDAVIHLAALKAAGESLRAPMRYYANNVAGSTCLLERMDAHRVRTLVFSSSASVYRVAGPDDLAPRSEASPIAPTSPYGRTKHIVEELLRDLCTADSRWRVSVLRYFNAVGAHPSGAIGESPGASTRTLLPCIAEVAAGRRESLDVFGADYPTRDGTCIRDYLHVTDLARAHVQALDYLQQASGLALHNLGSGRGHTVLEAVRAFERVCGRTIPHCIAERRPGDVPVCVADPRLARKELAWSADRNLEHICADLWRWQSKHPSGFD